MSLQKKKHRSGRLKAALQVRKTMDAIMAGSCRSFRQKRREKCGTENLFTRREELSGQIADLDKENFRLASMQEKLESQKRRADQSDLG